MFCYFIVVTIEEYADEKELVEELKNYKFYSKHIPITINNITDAFLNGVVFDSTLEILKNIKASKLENPCVIISKGYITKEQAQRLENLDMKIICLYTFSGLSEILENRQESKQIETIELLSKIKNLTFF